MALAIFEAAFTINRLQLRLNEFVVQAVSVRQPFHEAVSGQVFM